mmetsp:Transcript_30542/g.67728  ORF Transcript_30542/g.67728 Transcript_30542/m.67728 type:complete len:414 (+) Transcript_30542:477-1718(+)
MPVENIFVYKGGARDIYSRERQWVGDGPEVPSDVERVIVAPSVTEIGEHAFSGCSKLTSIEIPSSVTSVGAYAFDRCQSLTNVVIPDSFTEIGHFAFYGCSKLTSIAIPSSSVTEIGKYAFDGCSKLTSIAIPASVKSIGDRAFMGCKSLTNVVIPDSVTEIGEEAFRVCSKLTSIVIPPSIKSIGDGVFYECYLPAVDIPDSVESIGRCAFGGCTSLSSVNIPKSVRCIECDAFARCSDLDTVTMSSTIEAIDASAFRGCPLLQSIRIKDIAAKQDTGKRSIDEMVNEKSARNMSFDDLEKVYHERKRLKSSIDLTSDANVDEGIEPDGSGAALRNQVRQQQQYAANLVRVKKEKSAVKDDLEIEKETVTLQALATDRWQGRFDEVAELALAAGVDPQAIAEIRNRSLASGK